MWTDDYLSGGIIGASSRVVRLLSPDRASGGTAFPNTPVTLTRFILNLAVLPDALGGPILFQYGVGVGDQTSIALGTTPNPYSELFGWLWLDSIASSPLGPSGADHVQLPRVDTRVRRRLRGQEEALFIALDNVGASVTYTIATRMLWQLGAS